MKLYQEILSVVQLVTIGFVRLLPLVGCKALEQQLGRVDKLESQIGVSMIQDSYYGGYFGSVIDGRCRVGFL